MILLLPALTKGQLDYVEIYGLNTEDEVIEYCDAFTQKVRSSRKTKILDNELDSIIFYNNYLTFNEILNGTSENSELIADYLINVFAKSEFKGTRGHRALWIDPTNNSIGIGTTVIYNQNWATIGFEDPTIINKLNPNLIFLDELEY